MNANKALVHVEIPELKNQVKKGLITPPDADAVVADAVQNLTEALERHPHRFSFSVVPVRPWYTL